MKNTENKVTKPESQKFSTLRTYYKALWIGYFIFALLIVIVNNTSLMINQIALFWLATILLGFASNLQGYVNYLKNSSFKYFIYFDSFAVIVHFFLSLSIVQVNCDPHGWCRMFAVVSGIIGVFSVMIGAFIFFVFIKMSTRAKN